MARQTSHQRQLKNPKYRNWVKASLGFKYMKNGLETFSNEAVKEQHVQIPNKVKQRKGLVQIHCTQCTIRYLNPDHATYKHPCKFGLNNCNCKYSGKLPCPNKICGAIYDEIILFHASQPPNPNWKNSDAGQWCFDPWSVARCFINAPGYDQVSKAEEVDCAGLLHLFINSKFFQTKIQCTITGTDLFSKVRSARNKLYHSCTMEQEDAEVDEFIDDIISVLEDGQELLHRKESQAAVANLKELKGADFVISTEDEEHALKELIAEIKRIKEKFVEDVADANTSILEKGNEERQKVFDEAIKILIDIEQQRQKVKSELTKVSDDATLNIAKAGTSATDDISHHTDNLMSRLEDKTLKSTESIHEKGNEELLRIHDETTKSLTEIKELGQSVKSEFTKVSDDATLNMCSTIAKAGTSATDDISHHTDNLMARLEDRTLKSTESIHEQGNEELQRIRDETTKSLTDIKQLEQSVKMQHEHAQLDLHEAQKTDVSLKMNAKKDFQKRLINLYRDSDLVTISPILLQPEEACFNIERLYVESWVKKSTKTIKKQHVSMTFFEMRNKCLKQYI